MMRPQQWIVTMVACVLLLGQIVLAQAEMRRDVHGDTVYPGADEYEGVFVHTHGQSDDSPRTVVIDDSIFMVHSGAIFRNAHGGPISLENFKPQTPVGFFALGTLLTKMWVLGEPAVEKKADDTAGGTGRKEDASFFRDDKGVWRN